MARPRKAGQNPLQYGHSVSAARGESARAKPRKALEPQLCCIPTFVGEEGNFVSKLRELLSARAKTHADMVVLLNGFQSPDVRKKTDAMLAEIETQTADIDRINRADAVTAHIEGRSNASRPANGSVASGEASSRAKEYREAFVEYLRMGESGKSFALVDGGCSADSLTRLQEVRKKITDAPVEQRDQLAGQQAVTFTEGSVGGYFVPAGFVYDIETATKYYADLMNVVGVLRTKTGAVMPYPTANDTEQAWHILGESSQITDQGSSQNYPTVGTPPSTDAGNVLLNNVQFNAWKGSTGLIRVSLELLQDSAFELEPFLVERFAERLGRGYEAYLTNGTGSSQPTGFLPAIVNSGAVPVAAAGSRANDGVSTNTGVNSIGYPDLVNLIHSVDPTYRRNAKFQFHDLTLAHLKTRLDLFGRPLWVPSVQVGEPDRLCGYAYAINQSMPQIGPSNTVVAFGAWSKFIVRQVKDLQILRLDERFADYGEVAFVGFSRIDSKLVDAGTHPLNTLHMSS